MLPFENLSADKNNAYFADGMQDLILTKLADIGELKVISRTSTMAYGSHPLNLKTVGRQLGVATVLEGSVQKAGDQVLINVQLIDTRSDSHLWAQSYQRTLKNIFGVEGEVATKIAQALQARLTVSESAAVARVPTRNPAAYDAYLRGQTYRDQVSAGQVDRLPAMVASFKDAVHHDPTFALAWADLALGQAFREYFGQASTASMRKQALANAQHALALQPDLPQAHYALGYVYRFDFADYRRALEQFEIARRGLPNDATVEAAIAYIHAYQGHSVLAAKNIQRAATLNPRDPNVIYSYANALANLRRYDESRAVLQHLLAIAPEDPEAYAALAQVELVQHGDVQAAMHWLDQAPSDVQSKPSMIRQRLFVALIRHDAAAARRLMGQLKPGGRLFGPIDVLDLQSRVALQIGDRAQAQALARKVVAMAGRLLASPASESTTDVYWRLAIAQAILGQRASAMQSVQHLRAFLVAHIGEEHLAYGTAAMTQVGTILGDHGAAIKALRVMLEKAYGIHVSVPLLKIDPFWDPLRKDPRFQELLRTYARPAATPAHADST